MIVEEGVETWVDPAKLQKGDVLSLGGVGLVVLEVDSESETEAVWVDLVTRGFEVPFCEIYLELDSRVLVRRKTS